MFGSSTSPGPEESLKKDMHSFFVDIYDNNPREQEQPKNVNGIHRHRYRVVQASALTGRRAKRVGSSRGSLALSVGERVLLDGDSMPREGSNTKAVIGRSRIADYP